MVMDKSFVIGSSKRLVCDLAHKLGPLAGPMLNGSFAVNLSVWTLHRELRGTPSLQPRGGRDGRQPRQGKRGSKESGAG